MWEEVDPSSRAVWRCFGSGDTWEESLFLNGELGRKRVQDDTGTYFAHLQGQ